MVNLTHVATPEWMNSCSMPDESVFGWPYPNFSGPNGQPGGFLAMLSGNSMCHETKPSFWVFPLSNVSKKILSGQNTHALFGWSYEVSVHTPSQNMGYLVWSSHQPSEFNSKCHALYNTYQKLTLTIPKIYLYASISLGGYLVNPQSNPYFHAGPFVCITLVEPLKAPWRPWDVRSVRTCGASHWDTGIPVFIPKDNHMSHMT